MGKGNEGKFQPAMLPTWNPEQEGEVLEGKVIKSGVIQIDGRDTRYVDIRTDDGEAYKVFLSSAALSAYFEGVDILPGAEIGIRFDGEDESRGKRGNALKLYSCYYYPPKV